MKEFFAAALPWLCLGGAIALLIVLCIVNYHAHKKAREEQREYGNYANEGFCLGMIVGGLIFGAGYMLPGMLVGMAVGMCIRRPGKNEKADE